MKHTDFYNQYKYLDACTEDELKAAVKAHGNEYVFIHTDDDEHISEEKQKCLLLFLLQQNVWQVMRTFYVSRVAIEDFDSVVVYGFPKKDGSMMNKNSPA